MTIPTIVALAAAIGIGSAIAIYIVATVLHDRKRRHKFWDEYFDELDRQPRVATRIWDGADEPEPLPEYLRRYTIQ